MSHVHHHRGFIPTTKRECVTQESVNASPEMPAAKEIFSFIYI
jgi:hypothetical protein